jgi:PAS domain S-box-containing protein
MGELQASKSLTSDAIGERRPAVLICGPDSVVHYANEAAARLLDIASTKLTGASLTAQGLQFVREDGSPAPPSEWPVEQAVARRIPSEDCMACILPFPGAAPRWLCICAYPDLDPGGSVREVIVTMTPASKTDHTETEDGGRPDLAHHRLLASLNHIHQAMRETTEPEKLMRDVLDALLSIFDCDRAFLLYPCDPWAPCWEALMERTQLSRPAIFSLGQAIPMSDDMAAAMKALQASSGPMTFDSASDPLVGEATETENGRRHLAMAIHPKFGKAWLFGLERPLRLQPWTQWETTLFQEVGRRLSDSLIGLLAYRGLRDSERKYHEVFDHVSDSLVLFAADKQGGFRLSDMNPAAEKIIGVKKREILGKNLDEITSSEPALHSASKLRQVMETGAAVTYDEELNAASGRRIFNTTLLPIRDEIGSIYRLVVIGRDITEHKLAEEEIRSLNLELCHRVEDLEKANKELENISYSVSHCMKIPLRAIDGFSCLLLDEFKSALGGKGGRYLEVVRQNTARMSTLIDELLEFIGLLGQPMRVVRLDMTMLAREVFRELRALTPDRDIRLRLSQLPPAYGDKPMVRRILTNLLSNAIKFTARRTEAVVEIGGDSGPARNTYFIRDNGAGFDMRYADKLFGVFCRLHGEDEFAGPGGGLAIVKRIVERHEGEIWAEGKIDEGATVCFTLSAFPPET